MVSKIAGRAGLFCSSESRLGPLNQSTLSFPGADPQVPKSLGFSFVGM